MAWITILSMALYFRSFFTVMRLLANSHAIQIPIANRIISLKYLAYEPGNHLTINYSFGIVD